MIYFGLCEVLINRCTKENVRTRNFLEYTGIVLSASDWVWHFHEAFVAKNICRYFAYELGMGIVIRCDGILLHNFHFSFEAITFSN